MTAAAMLDTLPLPAVSTRAALREQVDAWRAEGLRIGFVPTMGALHPGHISLIETALEKADRVVASIFVNPTQFAPGEDFQTYPRTLENDAVKLAEAGCHLLYAPSAEEMYPDGFATTVSVAGPAEGLESEARPHFFAGVATVVSKLFNQVRPDLAVFGEKDYQQLLVIKRMTADLDLGVEIIAGETLREPDGLAMSSRNAYLDDIARETAGKLNKLLIILCDCLQGGETVLSVTIRGFNAANEVFDSVDYLEVRDAETLAPVDPGPIDRPVRVLAAVRVGTVRLIDNMQAVPSRRRSPGADLD